MTAAAVFSENSGADSMTKSLKDRVHNSKADFRQNLIKIIGENRLTVPKYVLYNSTCRRDKTLYSEVAQW